MTVQMALIIYGSESYFDDEMMTTEKDYNLNSIGNCIGLV